MPRKKTVVSSSARSRSQPKDSSIFHWFDSFIGFIVGVVFVFICLGIFLGFMQYKKMGENQHQKDISTAAHIQATPTFQGESIKPVQIHIVQAQESLYTIAQKEYNDGDKWGVIAKANGIMQPSLIYTNDKLIIPILDDSSSKAMSQVTPTTSPSAQPSQQATQIKAGSQYIVQAGDTIWGIAVKVYGDGYRYKDIVVANHLDNPSLIFSGNVLIIPHDNGD